ncbi:MAG: SPOR domain-containing protein, partial [Alphaproteobacteria bacterium]
KSIAELENKWEAIRTKNRAALNGYNPYFSIDTVAEGGMPDLFRLRVGPMDDLQKADDLCAKLSKKGVSCSVIKTQ